MRNHIMLAVAVAAFLIMTGVCIYQNRVIQDQGGCIRKMFEDGFAINTKPQTRLQNPDDWAPPEGDQ